MYYFRPPTHVVAGRPESLTARPRTSNKETTILIGHMTDQDEVRLTPLWSAGLPPNARNIAEHIHEIETAGEACFIRSQLSRIKCRMTRIWWSCHCRTACVRGHDYAHEKLRWRGAVLVSNRTVTHVQFSPTIAEFQEKGLKVWRNENFSQV